MIFLKTINFKLDKLEEPYHDNSYLFRSTWNLPKKMSFHKKVKRPKEDKNNLERRKLEKFRDFYQFLIDLYYIYEQATFKFDNQFDEFLEEKIIGLSKKMYHH